MMSFLWVGYASRVHRYSYFDPSIEYSNAGGGMILLSGAGCAGGAKPWPIFYISVSAPCAIHLDFGYVETLRKGTSLYFPVRGVA